LGAQEELVTLEATDGATREARVRSAVSSMLVFHNKDSQSRHCILQATLPEGWRALSPRAEVSLEAGGSALYLASALVPSQALAGEYPLRYSLWDTDLQAMVAECTITVKVHPEVALEFRTLDKPRFVVAGDRYELTCMLANTGNKDITVRFEDKGNTKYSLEYRGLMGYDTTLLTVGEVRQLAVMVTTDAYLNIFTTHHLTVRAMLLNTDPSLPQRSTPLGFVQSAVDLVPKSVDSRFIVHTLPVNVQTTSESQYDGGFSGSLSETLSADGSLDDRGDHKVDLYLNKRLGTSSDTPWLDSEDRYTLKYRNDLFGLVLGDESYEASPLLGSGGIDRGAQAYLNFLPMRVGGSYYKSTRAEEEKQNLSGSASFTIPRDGDWSDYAYRANFNVLSQLDDRVSYGLAQGVQLKNGIKCEADVALQHDSSDGLFPALYASSEGAWSFMDWRGLFIRAWPDFEGLYHDIQSIQSVVNVRLLQGYLTLSGGFDLADRNLALDSSLAGAERTRDCSFGVLTTIPGWGTKLGLSWDNQRRSDRLDVPAFDDWDNIFTIQARQEFAAITASVSSKLDFGSDAIDDSTDFSHDDSLTVQYKPEGKLDYAAMLKFSGSSDDVGNSQSTTGIDLMAKYSDEGLNLDGHLRNYYTFSQAGWESTDVGVSAQLSNRFYNGHVLSAVASLSLSETETTTSPGLSLSLGYRVPLKVPVSRKHDTAIVKGRIYNTITGMPMPGALIRLNGLVAVSNEKGEYTFYLPRTSATYLFIDRGTVPANMVSTITLPLTVNTIVAQDQTIDIGMVESCSVTGSIGLYELAAKGAFVNGDAEKAQEADYVRERGLGNLVVELSDGKESRRKVTNQDGAFSFPETRPGRYTLKIVGGQIPSYHTATPSALELDLAPGEARDVEIRVQQDRRQIQLQEEASPVILESTNGMAGERTIIQEPARPKPQPLEPPKPPEPPAAQPEAADPVSASSIEIIPEASYSPEIPEVAVAPETPAAPVEPDAALEPEAPNATVVSTETEEVIPEPPAPAEAANPAEAAAPAEVTSPAETAPSVEATSPAEATPSAGTSAPAGDSVSTAAPSVQGEPREAAVPSEIPALPNLDLPGTWAKLGVGFGPEAPAPSSDLGFLLAPLPETPKSASQPEPSTGMAVAQEVEPELVTVGFKKFVPYLGTWILKGMTLRQTDPEIYFAKLMIPVEQEMVPMRFAFTARSTGRRWVGVGMHVFVSKTKTYKGYGNGDSLLVWFTYDKVHYKADRTRMQLYRSYSDTRMYLLAEAPVDADIFAFNRIEIDVDPVGGKVEVRLNDAEALRVEGVLGLGRSDATILRTIDTAEFTDFQAGTLPRSREEEKTIALADGTEGG